jgi:hypothetical protein
MAPEVAPFDAGTVGTQVIPPNPIDGDYAGMVSGFTFSDGSSAIAISLTALNANMMEVIGAVRFGTAPIVPPPMSIDQFPPGYDGVHLPDLPGYWYRVLAGAYSSSMVTFSIDRNDAFSDWCNLQNTVYPGPVEDLVPGEESCDASQCPRYGCIPDGVVEMVMGDAGPECAIAQSGGPALAIDCKAAVLCNREGGVCSPCNVDIPMTTVGSCLTHLVPGGINFSITFNANVTPPSLTGTVSGLGDGISHAIVLTQSDTF